MINQKREKTISYVLIAIIVISLANFGFKINQKNNSRNLDKLYTAVNKLQEENSDLSNQQYELESTNDDIKYDNEHLQNNSGQNVDLKKYTKENRDAISKQVDLMEKDKLIFTALPLNNQLEALSNTILSGMSGHYSYYSDSTLESYTIEEVESDKILVFKDKEDKNQTYEIFLFGPYGAVLHFDKKTLQDEYKVGMRDSNLADLSFSGDLSYLRELGDNDDED